MLVAIDAPARTFLTEADLALHAMLRRCIYRAPQLCPIRGYAGLYDISDDGRVWAYARRWTTGGGGRIQRFRRAGWLQGNVNGDGYVMVNLHKGSGGRSYQIHRLVAQAFLPNPHNLPTVNHRNLRRNDNRASNLEWCSAGENKRHSAAARRRGGRFAHIHPRPAANDA